MANRPQYEKVVRYLQTALDEGAVAACGGEPDERLGGLFVKPTVFTGVDPEGQGSATGDAGIAPLA